MISRVISRSCNLRSTLSQPPFIKQRNFLQSISLQQYSVKQKVTINFVDPTGTKSTFEVDEGISVLDAAKENNIDLEGACESSLACSTCHVYVDKAYFDKVPEAEEEEEDMLDLAFGLTELSRLGCQIKITKELEGCTFTLPKATRNMLSTTKK